MKEEEEEREKTNYTILNVLDSKSRRIRSLENDRT